METIHIVLDKKLLVAADQAAPDEPQPFGVHARRAAGTSPEAGAQERLELKDR